MNTDNNQSNDGSSQREPLKPKPYKRGGQGFVPPPEGVGEGGKNDDHSLTMPAYFDPGAEAEEGGGDGGGERPYRYMPRSLFLSKFQYKSVVL